MGKRIILSVCMLLLLFSCDHENKDRIYKTSVTPSDKEVKMKSSSGVQIEIPPYTISEDRELMIRTPGKIPEKRLPESCTRTLVSIEVTLGDKSQLDDYMRITIPFNPGDLEGADPEAVLDVYTTDPETGEPELLLSEIQGNTIIAYTDHLSYFEVNQNLYSIEGKIRRAGLEMNRDDLVAFVKKIKGGSPVKDSTAELAWNSFNTGLGWSADFGSVAQLLKQTDHMSKFLDGFSSLGNIMFYMGTAKDLIEGMENDDYTVFRENILVNGLGFLVGKLATPHVQAAYAAVKVMLYMGDVMQAYLNKKTYAKFDYAYDKIYDTAVMETFRNASNKNNPSLLAIDYKISWYKKILKILNTVTPEKFEPTLRAAVLHEVSAPLSEKYFDDFTMYLGEYVQEYQGEDNWLFKVFKLRTGDNLDAFLDQKVVEKLAELKPVLLKASQYLLTQTEAAFYKQLSRMKQDLYTPYILTLQLQGGLPEKAEVEYQLQHGSEVVERFPNNQENSVKHAMTINDYLRLEAPHTIAAVIQSQDGTKTIKKDFVMKKANQTIVFNTGLAEEKPAPEEKTNDDEEITGNRENPDEEEYADTKEEPWRSEFEGIKNRITSAPEYPSSGSDDDVMAWETAMWNWYNSMISIIGIKDGIFTNPRVYEYPEYQSEMEGLLNRIYDRIDVLTGGR
ncbi:MAG: hypothetical protein JXJ04_08965 [Spirochaetales bacterium]|nr:hypothetical protein [Spirochaetales bacterium]